MKRAEFALADTPDSAVIFARARARGAEDRAYAGAVGPTEAWALVVAGAATLVDVRSAAELQYVGRVPGAHHAQWNGHDPAAVAGFIAALRAQFEPGAPLLLLCRSAVRSHHAGQALAAAGWPAVYNVLEGFEGQRDHAQQRGHLDGWRRHGLPWIQD